jgi:hypothetical protein
MQRGFVSILLPENGEGTFLLPFQEGSVHRGTNKAATNP